MIIKLDAVSKTYSAGARVLHDVSLEVQQGELVAIVGTSGSGKSTLLNIIGGLDADYSGDVVVAEQRLSELNDKKLSAFRNATVGFIFQQFNLLEHLSCLENVVLPSVFSRDSDEEAVSKGRAALQRVGLADRAGDLAANLSGGQKQRVAIARALFNRPPILLCDEPTGNLDSETGRQIIDLFNELNDEGITLVIVTHEARVSSVAGRIIRLEDGKLATAPAADKLELGVGA